MTADESGRLARSSDQRIALARERDDLIEQVRRLDGFADFLRPPSPESLREATAGGPVVVVNVSRWGCNALIVTTEGPLAVPLPDLTAAEVEWRTRTFLAALDDHGSDVPAVRAAVERRDTVLRSTTAWLWDVIAEPVLTALGLDEVPEKPGRLWWCPTGLLTLLPLHGAGYHDADDGRTVLDRVVSSYTPTLRALAEARKPRPAGPTDDGRLLFVGGPEARNLAEMAEDVARERDFLTEHLPALVLSGQDATVDAVHRAMAGRRLVHFSCHGSQDLDKPSAAGLVLADGTLTLGRLMGGQYAGDLAFLSACRTAAGGVNLPDEVITLAAALSYTGYRHVIATLWLVVPATAADVTIDVYTGLLTGDGIDPERCAAALHGAVRKLRAAGTPLYMWLPFTHSGP